MPNIILLVGPPGSGKSTLAKKMESDGWYRINQDSQGKDEHLALFMNALAQGLPIVVDRMNFDKKQRARYLEPAKKAGYSTQITVIHESLKTCYERIEKRENHETIHDAATGRKVLHFFFTNYERPTPDEADCLEFKYPQGEKPYAVVCDLDGTLCNVEHRRHFVRREGKKDWRSFFQGISQDAVNEWCRTLLREMGNSYKIVYASGRGDELEKETRKWLQTHGLDSFCDSTGKWVDADLYMRPRSTHRQDYIVKEIILDFEILTRFEPIFFIDDRKQVVDMWRRRGYTCLQCDEGDF